MVKEKQFERKIKAWIKKKGGWCVKYHGDAFSTAGIPDLLACLDGRFVGIEVKAEDGEPSQLQIWTVKQIRKAGGAALVLYPSGFDRFKRWAEDGFKKKIPIEVR